MDGRRIDRSNIISGFSGTFSPSFETIMNKFFVSLAISLIGMVVGFLVLPKFPALYPVAVGAELIMIVSTLFLRSRVKIGFPFVYAYTFLSGMTLFPAIAYYVQVIGVPLVATAVGITTLGFGVLAFYGYTTKKDLSFMRSMLIIGLIALVGFGLVGLFVPSINMGLTGMLIAIGGVLVFSGFTVLDMNLYAKNIYTEQDLAWCVLAIYLDYINLLLYVLRILAIFSGNGGRRR